MPNIMKNVQQIKTILPMGRNDDNSVCTTNFRPGARLMTRNGRNERNKRKTRRMPKMRGLDWLSSDMSRSTIDMTTKTPSIIFQPDIKYALLPSNIPAATTCAFMCKYKWKNYVRPLHQITNSVWLNNNKLKQFDLVCKKLIYITLEMPIMLAFAHFSQPPHSAITHLNEHLQRKNKRKHIVRRR